jgi:serine/threonine protein kinase/beta-lactam-binding protein with PASTA domain
MINSARWANNTKIVVMDDTLADPLTGRLLDGRYAVTARIAQGGMATVYRATDTRLDREVALKVMHAELARDDDFVRRFIGEAKSVARLSHQNVVAVFDQGADGPFLYLAMEYVPGRTLKELLRDNGRLLPQVALEIMTGVLDGLAAAHASGIVHRDIKPENVLLTADGRIKVADFGLARAHAAAGHTRAGLLIGTVAYVPPEQVTGDTTGPRGDVYSAGVMLFEMLTGRQPFTGDTPLSVAYQHVNSGVPAASTLVHGIPAAVDQLVLAATSRDPLRRPADAGEFGRAVRQVKEDISELAGMTGMIGVGVQGLAEAPWLDLNTPAATNGWWARTGSFPAVADDTGPAISAAAISPPVIGPASIGPSGTGIGPSGIGPSGTGPSGTGPSGTGPSGTGQFGNAHGGGQYGTGQLGNDQIGTGQFNTGQFSNGQYGTGQNSTGQFSNSQNSTGQFGTEQFSNGQFGTEQFSNGQYGNGQYGAGFGSGQSGTGPYGSSQFGMGTFGAGRPDDGGSHTLIVDREDGGRYPGAREPFLQRWLFSPRLVIVLLVLLLGAGFAFGGWYLTAGRYAQVPTLTGYSVSQATTALTADGFTVKQQAPVHSNTVPKGTVVGTSPAGRAAKGTPIALLVSDGPFTSIVPKVANDTLAAAQAALQRVHLVPTTQNVASTSPVGTVLGTNPGAGTNWPQTKTVAILVAVSLPLPNFVGQDVQVAQQWASQHGVSLVQQADNNSQQAAGIVTGQQPAANATFQQGSTITVEVSSGPQEVNVPSPIGMSVEQATQTLQAAGFQVQTHRYGFNNKVFDFSPVGQAPRGSTITLDVGF